MKNKIITIIFALIIGVISIVCWVKPHTEFSESERRLLAQKPDFSLESVAGGEFMAEFENYVVDQFPLRDSFRKIKAIFATKIFNKKDNNGLFAVDGHISKIEYPVNPEMVNYAEERLDFIFEKYLKDKNVSVYLSIVPDKNYFLAEKNGYLSIDYDRFINNFADRMDYMEYINIIPLLSQDDYYKTDSHWKQEEITDVAEFVAEKMGEDVRSEYNVNKLDNPFKGVYLGQSALPFKPDTIKYLTNDILLNSKVSYFDTGKAVLGDMYNMEKAYGKDPYEMFLSGTSALIEIENSAAENEKELVIFRDSFGSSFAPLMVPGYRKVTVVDIRYVDSRYLDSFIKFDNQDVLFLYSTTLLNNSKAMR